MKDGALDDISRRVFVKGLGYVGFGLVATSLLGGCEALRKQIQNRPTRRRLRIGSPEVDQAIDIYRQAVVQMRALPNSDPRSWNAQAALHGTTAGFNFCEHNTAHFFSWHRAYLVFFEQICQRLTGDKTFGLPYWNWNQDPALHPSFTSAGSALSHPRTRSSVAGNSAFTDATLGTILADTNFFTFSSQLEGTPHNTAHVLIGGQMRSAESPLDPIFWAHHCMVDYCWAKWNIELGNDNTDDAGWGNTSWNHFVDGDGNPTRISAGITTLLPLLSYQYETSAVGGFAAGLSVSSRSMKELKSIEDRLRAGAPISYQIRRRIPITRGADLSLGKPFSVESPLNAADISSLIEPDPRSERVFLNVKAAGPPPADDFFIRAFINLPTADVRTSTDDIHYAGSFAFFGTAHDGHSGHGGRTDFLVNVTETLRRLRKSGQLRDDQPVSVQLVTVPATDAYSRPDLALPIEDISFIISPMILKQR